MPFESGGVSDSGCKPDIYYWLKHLFCSLVGGGADVRIQGWKLLAKIASLSLFIWSID